ncbi:MAG: endonuclease/exonuclease/phosphatase family protein [Flavobacteriales bacterium]
MKILVTFFLFIISLFCFSQNNNSDNFSDDLFFMFYNVENLFDTINSLDNDDNEFLPKSKKKWNSQKYYHKLEQLDKVFLSLVENENNNSLPDIIGLCEVENRLVIEDLLASPSFLGHNYTIVHKESPDKRGIDCALLFTNEFEVLKKDFILIDNPDVNSTTREIVFVKLKLSSYVINIFVNHWPSRWGGQEKSNYKRVFASNVLREYINLNTSDDEYTVIMGDFNDYPSNESISKLTDDEKFINLMTSKFISGIGSYNYKGNWNWLDQILVSKNFTLSNINLISSGSFKRDFMLYKNKNGEGIPSRSFGGNNWYGGFSDHLPVYFKFNFMKNN